MRSLLSCILVCKLIIRMETARLFRRQQRDTLIIFITAAPEYVFQAFDVGAFHYLVKPLSDDKFDEVFGNALLGIGRGIRAEMGMMETT